MLAAERVRVFFNQRPHRAARLRRSRKQAWTRKRSQTGNVSRLNPSLHPKNSILLCRNPTKMHRRDAAGRTASDHRGGHVRNEGFDHAEGVEIISSSPRFQGRGT